MMRYVITDYEGAVRGRYSTRLEALRALDRIEEDHPGMSEDLYVLCYDGGFVVGDETFEVDLT